MRLYLSSFRVGDHPEHLLSMLRGKSRAAVIANAMDPYDSRGLEIEFVALTELGLQPQELDLRDYFDRPSEAADALARYDLVWVRGGNVFALRHALAKSGADEALIALLRDDALVYGGYSAGPCVLAPSLRGLEHCDDPAPVQRLYGEPVIFDGLGVIEYAFVPHTDSPEHPESAALDEVAARYRAEGVAHRALRDGQVLVVDGEAEFVAG